METNRLLAAPIPQVWVPHSLGALKKRNVDPSAWSGLRIDERIALERTILQRVVEVGATSAAIRGSLQDDYGVDAGFFVPPGVDPKRFKPRDSSECPDVSEFLAESMGRPIDEVLGRPLILEVSRTDTTKRKDILIKAFAAARKRHPGALLAVTIDDVNEPLRDELLDLIHRLGLSDEIAVLGSIWDRLPCLYSSCDIYCTPSVMEGFGMSAEEAAASGKPIISSELVPFVCEYLLGDGPRRVPVVGSPGLLVGEGAIVAESDDVEAFAAALDLLLSDEELRSRMGTAALHSTVPAFSWNGIADELLTALTTEGAGSG
jgi:mannosylfructose-phosphate synthase